MAEIFVSYSRADRAAVAPLVAAIEATGRTVWWDPDIAPGQEFDRQITAELERAKAVLVVWTPRSVESRWVRGEAREAADRGILVPVRLEGARLPLDARALQTIDLDPAAVDPRSVPVQQMLSALDATVARQHEAARAPAATPAAMPAAPLRHRIAVCVLPFANMSVDPDQEYFSDGITEDIITDLSKVSALAVVSRNSVFRYKGQHVDLPRVAREFGASHVLEGSVRKADGRVRITAQLVDAASNDHVWAERYDRDLKDIFALQDEISHAIVRALQVRLLPEERQAFAMRGTNDAEAYNLYLMARQLYVSTNEGDVRRAEGMIRLCQRAIGIDPDYARAWTLLALGQATLRYMRGGGYDSGLAAAERALALDPDLAEAHAIKAKILSEAGDYEAASPEIDIALRLDPESYEVNRAAGYLRYRQHRPGEAIPYFEHAVRLMENDINSATMLLSSCLAVGREEDARRAARIAVERAEQALALDPYFAPALGSGATALATLGDKARAREWARRAMLADPDNLKVRYNYACFLMVPLGETEEALAVLAPLFELLPAGMINHIRGDPDLDALRGDPRFQALLAAADARLAAATTDSAPTP